MSPVLRGLVDAEKFCPFQGHLTGDCCSACRANAFLGINLPSVPWTPLLFQQAWEHFRFQDWAGVDGCDHPGMNASCMGWLQLVPACIRSSP